MYRSVYVYVYLYMYITTNHMYICSNIHSQDSNGGAEVDGQVVIPAGQKLSAEVGVSSVSQCLAACCSMLQRVAACCKE